MRKFYKNKSLLIFLFIIFSLTIIIFQQVFFQNKILLNSNLLASFFNPWAIEKFPNWETGIPNKPTGKDDLWIFYPQRTFTTDILKKWEIPFWNPYSFSGNYHLGLSETAVFYPLNFLFFLFPQINVWVFLAVIEPIITGIGMYLFLKKIVINEKSVILGSLAFAFSGIVIVRAIEGLSVGHTLIWMPYVFWGIESYFHTKKIRFLWIIILFLTFSLLAGWFQYTFYIIVFSLIYTVFKLYFDSKNHSRSDYLIIIPFLILPLITLFHTVPAFQALLDSPRSALEGGVFSFNHLMPINHIFTLIFPDYWGNPAVYNYFGKSDYKESMMFIGVIPIVFSLISIFGKKTKKENFFIGAILVSFILAIESPLSKIIISSYLPVFSSFLPNRIFLISTFSLCVVSAFGLDCILSEKKEKIIEQIKKSFIFIWFIVIILFLFLLFQVIKDPGVLNKIDKSGINLSKEAIQFKNSIFPILFLLITTIVFFVFKKGYRNNIFFFAILFIFFSQSYIFSQKYIPFSNRQFIYPSHPVFNYLRQNQGFDRFMSAGIGHVVPSIPLQFQLYSPEGIGSMYLRRYGEYVRYMKLGDYGIPDKIAFDLEIYPKDVFNQNSVKLHRFFELTSVKYIAVDKKSMKDLKIISPSDFQLVWENEKWQIFQYKKSMPRFFATSNFEIISDRKEILKSLFNNSFKPNKIVLEENPGFNPSNYQGSLKILNYSSNKILMEISTEKPTLVYFSDNYSKSFKVLIDEKEGKIIRANYTFRAIPVLKGKHKLLVTYNDKFFFIGLLISVVTLAVIIILSFVCIRFKKSLKLIT